MARRIREFDWASHPLGPIELWPQTLLTTLNMMLAAPVAMQLFWGPEFFTFYNDELLPILTDKHPRALGWPAQKVWAEVWSTIGPQMQAVLDTGEPIRHSALFLPIHRNGVQADAYWDYSYSAVPGPDGRVEGVIDIVRDATASVQAAQAKRDADERLELALEGAGLGMWSYYPGSGVIFADEQMRRMFGAAATSGPVNAWLELVHPDDRARLRQDLTATVRQKQPFNLEFRVVRADGVRWLHCKGRIVVAADGSEHVAAVVEDITDRKNIEGALQTSERDLRASQDVALRSEEQLNTITDALPVYISYLTPELRYARVNRAYATTLGRPEADLLGKHIEDILDPSAVRELRPHLEQAFRGKRQVFEATLRLGGQDRFINVNYIPDCNQDGSVRGVIVQSEDITERKKTEELLIRTEKLAAVGRLAASIAHEINNPLESVTNLLFLAQGGQVSDEVREYLEIADRELRRVSVITNQTLRFYKQSTRPRPVTCEELISSVLSMHQGRLVNSRIQVDADRCMDQVFECFEGEIRQVLNNLVGNAIDAMHPRGGKLFLRGRRGRNWETGEPGVVLTVADTGAGMSPAVRSRLFEAFYTTKGIGGTGLGLWVSKEIVDRHHGALRVRSSEKANHSGTVFTLFLPLHAVAR